MNPSQSRRTSKFLSLVLRHQPATIGIKLNSAGWVKVDELLAAIDRHPNNIRLNRKSLEQVVNCNDKQRFEFDKAGTSIRARQGHSLDVDLGYQPTTPPETLVHGTPRKFVATICETGLKKMNRHHVHLHTDLRRVAVENLPTYRRHPAAGRWQDAADTVHSQLPIALKRRPQSGPDEATR